MQRRESTRRRRTKKEDDEEGNRLSCARANERLVQLESGCASRSLAVQREDNVDLRNNDEHEQGLLTFSMDLREIVEEVVGKG